RAQAARIGDRQDDPVEDVGRRFAVVRDDVRAAGRARGGLQGGVDVGGRVVVVEVDLPGEAAGRLGAVLAIRRAAGAGDRVSGGVGASVGRRWDQGAPGG